VTVLRSAYLPPAWFVDDVHLVFDLDPHATRVQSTLSVRRNPVATADVALVLDGEGLELLDLCIDGERPASESWHADERTLTITGLPDHCTVRTTVRIDPRANTALSGLYESSDGLFTQCEAQGFRRITWFPDRPDVMARYTVTLRGAHERYPILLSNGNLVASGPYAHSTEAGWHQATWHDPFPKPSYLFALVAGRLAVSERRLRTRSGREVLLQAWVEPGNEGRTVHALDSLERAIRWDEERFGLELDLDRFMIVAVGDFNMGAMENKGLNIFNSKYVLADPEIATDRDFAAIESVVGHEYFHNWTGNRVTCRDWFQLTLKEGLTVFRDQEFSADMLAARQREPGSLPPDGSARSDASDVSDVSGEAPAVHPPARAHAPSSGSKTCACCARPSSPKMPARWRIRCDPTPTRKSTTSTPSPSTKKGPRSSGCCRRSSGAAASGTGSTGISSVTTARRSPARTSSLPSAMPTGCRSNASAAGMHRPARRGCGCAGAMIRPRGVMN